MKPVAGSTFSWRLGNRLERSPTLTRKKIILLRINRLKEKIRYDFRFNRLKEEIRYDFRFNVRGDVEQRNVKLFSRVIYV